MQPEPDATQRCPSLFWSLLRAYIKKNNKRAKRFVLLGLDTGCYNTSLSEFRAWKVSEFKRNYLFNTDWIN